MRINITDQIVSEFLSGVTVVLALLAVGGFLLFLLKSMHRTFPFTRMGITLALAPLSLVRFLGNGESSVLFLYSMIAALLGITIDGINHLLTPKERVKLPSDAARKEDEHPRVKEEEAVPTRPGVIVWEKAE